MKPKLLIVDDTQEDIDFFVKLYTNDFGIQTHFVGHRPDANILDADKAIQVIREYGKQGLVLLDSLGVFSKKVVVALRSEGFRNIVIFTNDPDHEDVKFAHEFDIPVINKVGRVDEKRREIMEVYQSVFGSGEGEITIA